MTVLLRCAGVCYRLRYRLSDIDVAERGVRLDASTVFASVREFAPPYEDAARSFRRAVGSTWSVAVYRAVDGRGQVVDVYVSDRRAAGDAAALFGQAIAAMGMVPEEVTTAAVRRLYPPLDTRSSLPRPWALHAHAARARQVGANKPPGTPQLQPRLSTSGRVALHAPLAHARSRRERIAARI